MKQFRRRSAFVAVGVLALVVAACGSSSKKSASNSNAGSSATTVANATPIKIGVLLPESGPSAANGAQHKFLLSLDPTGQAYADALNAAAGPAGITIGKTVTFQPSTLDLSNQVSQLKAANADPVYVAAVSPADIANVVKAMDEVGYHPTLLGNSALSVPAVSDAVPNAKNWVKTWQASGYGIKMVQGNLSPEVMKWHDQMVQLIGAQANTLPLNGLVVIQDAFDMFKAAV